jgi:hypothetical protein
MRMFWVLLLVAVLLLVLARPALAPALPDIEKIRLFGDTNNNPFNVRPIPGGWRGQVGVDYRGLTMFDTLESGVRAGVINILTQFRRRPDLTLSEFGAKYAPASAGNPPDYGERLARTLRYDPYAPYNIDAPGALERLAAAVLLHEEGAPARDALLPYLSAAADVAREYHATRAV